MGKADEWECEKCGYVHDLIINYCPNCWYGTKWYEGMHLP